MPWNHHPQWLRRLAFHNTAEEIAMTVTMAIRYAVADVKVATNNTKKARAMYMKAGAKDFRVRQFFTGVFNGEWLFHIDFEDFAHFQKCRDAVQNSKDMASINATNRKAGNKQVAREMLIGLDV
jgi:hypothetical protein